MYNVDIECTYSYLFFVYILYGEGEEMKYLTFGRIEYCWFQDNDQEICGIFGILEDKNSKKHNIIDEFQFVEMYVGLNALMAEN